MAIKRLRIFAGPNGSGKSTILKSILINRNIDLGIYVNADDIEVLLNQCQKLNFSDFKLSVNETCRSSEFRRHQS
jgi:predicted ABC-type ATPase